MTARQRIVGTEQWKKVDRGQREFSYICAYLYEYGIDKLTPCSASATKQRHRPRD